MGFRNFILCLLRYLSTWLKSTITTKEIFFIFYVADEEQPRGIEVTFLVRVGVIFHVLLMGRIELFLITAKRNVNPKQGGLVDYICNPESLR